MRTDAGGNDARSQVPLRLIEPGKPTQNAYIESFNGRFCDGISN